MAAPPPSEMGLATSAPLPPNEGLLVRLLTTSTKPGGALPLPLGVEGRGVASVGGCGCPICCCMDCSCCMEDCRDMRGCGGLAGVLLAVELATLDGGGTRPPACACIT